MRDNFSDWSFIFSSGSRIYHRNEAGCASLTGAGLCGMVAIFHFQSSVTRHNIQIFRWRFPTSPAIEPKQAACTRTNPFALTRNPAEKSSSSPKSRSHVVSRFPKRNCRTLLVRVACLCMPFNFEPLGSVVGIDSESIMKGLSNWQANNHAYQIEIGSEHLVYSQRVEKRSQGRGILCDACPKIVT